VALHSLAEEVLRVESNLDVALMPDAIQAARVLFERLLLFKPRLETSLQVCSEKRHRDIDTYTCTYKHTYSPTHKHTHTVIIQLNLTQSVSLQT
jgi:hypothetical protein